MSIDYNETIPNNVNLADDRRLLRALERWQPAYLKWWDEMGPTESSDLAVYLRTAISVEKDGWANYGHVRMPEYRWGIFLAPPEDNRRVGFGVHKGEAAWQSVPGEYRSELRRLIVTQGDTEPASVEQQRRLGKTCPSLYDLRNLFQVNVEEGRHLWAMVYLLHAYFGREYERATHGIRLEPPPRPVVGRAREVLTAADVVLTASGTASLEAALLKRPMVVAYIISGLTHRLLKLLGLNKLEYFSLPNLLAGLEIVPEFLQADVRPAVLGPALQNYLTHPIGDESWRGVFEEIHLQLRRNASDGAADAVLDLLRGVAGRR